MNRKEKNKDKRSYSAESIKNMKDIARIRSILVDKPRDLLLFELVIHTGLPAQQLLQLKVKDLEGLKIGDTLTTSPTGSKVISFVVNETVYHAFHFYLNAEKPADSDHLFASRKGNKPITLSSMSRLVKGWFKSTNISNNSSILSLRKLGKFLNSDSVPEANPESRGQKEIIFKPVLVRTKQEIVLEELEHSILSGRIPPGKRLIDKDIAQQMNVSRNPVRDALGRLQALNFISSHKGVNRVNELSKGNVREILKIRLMLETMAAKEATFRTTEEMLQKLETLHENLISAWGDIDELLRINKEFHFMIYGAADMPILTSMIETLWNKYSPYLHILIRERDDLYPKSATEIHRNMLESLKRRDPEAVTKWLKTDLIVASDLVATMIDRAKE